MSDRPGRGRRLERVLAVLGALGMGYHLLFHLSTIRSPSMAPTLHGGATSGDWVLSERVSYRLREPRRYELVAYRTPEGIQVMKRVIAFAGERVASVEGKLVIDGAPAELPGSIASLKHLPYGHLAPGQTYTVPAGYFVLGDDTKDSQDSRFEGALSADAVFARPWLVVWPPRRVGFVNP